MSDSGFLEALYLADLLSWPTDTQRGKKEMTFRDLGCKTVQWYTGITFGLQLCPCQLARTNLPLNMNEYSVNVRLQRCCDYWMGRAQQGENKRK